MDNMNEDDEVIYVTLFCELCGAKMIPSKTRMDLITKEEKETLECNPCKKWVFV